MARTRSCRDGRSHESDVGLLWSSAELIILLQMISPDLLLALCTAFPQAMA